MRAVGNGGLDVASRLLDMLLSAVSIRDTSRPGRTALPVLLAAEVYARDGDAAVSLTVRLAPANPRVMRAPTREG
eukprot:8037162-Alexandrium_andersonii.AAC.1